VSVPGTGVVNGGGGEAVAPPARLPEALLDALGTLRRAPGYTLAVATAATLGSAAALPILALRHPEGLRAGFDGDAGVARLLSGDWPAGWGTVAETPAQHVGVLALRGMLVALAGLALAMACATVMALVLSRGAARRQEVAVRAALGAGPGRVAREIGVEALLLALGAAAAGALCGAAGMLAVSASRPELLRAWLVEGAGPLSVGIALGAPALALLCFAPLPALGAASWWLAPALRAGARATPSPGEGALRHTLGVAQLAAALSLLVGAGLLLRGGQGALRGPSLLMEIAPPPRARGVDPSTPATLPAAVAARTLLLDVRPGAAGRSERAGYYAAALVRLARMPGVESASAAAGGAWAVQGPQAMVQFTCPLCYIDGVGTPVKAAIVQHQLAAPGFGAVLGGHILRGRDLSLADSAGAALVAVVNRSFEELFQGLVDPVGQHVRVGATGQWVRIVGVIPDIRSPGLGAAGGATPTLYLPLLQFPPTEGQLVVRLAPGATAAGAARVEQRVVAAAKAAGGAEVRTRGTLAAACRRLAAPLRWAGGAALALAAAALLLAAHGVGAVAVDEVRRRRRELAVRAALGASPRRIAGHVLARALGRVVAGAAWACGGAILVAWMLERTSPELPLFDWRIYLGGLAVIGGVSLAASVRAALNATRIEPRETLSE